jgi:hypothetical protein
MIQFTPKMKLHIYSEIKEVGSTTGSQASFNGAENRIQISILWAGNHKAGQAHHANYLIKSTIDIV